MIRKSTAAIVLIALLGAFSVPTVGQEEPLPVVTPKAVQPDLPFAQPAIVLAVEPIRDIHTPTLVEAARNNDYVSFAALYAEALQRGEDVSRFATLHELWTYAVTDPIGAFYGPEMYARLSAAYPGFAAYIAEFRIVDSRGNVFYPTSESRAFLLDRAVEGERERALPRVVVAERVGSSSDVVSAAAPARGRDARASAGGDAGVPVAVGAPVARVAAPVAVAEPAARIAAPVADAPTLAPAPGPTPTPTPIPTPAARLTPGEVAVPTDTALLPTRDNPTSRGILLVIVGLIAVALLGVILRTRQQPEVVHHG